MRNLAGVPSVVYGILGLAIFVELARRSCTGGSSVVCGRGLTLAVLVLPIVIITSAEAIRAVPQATARGRPTASAPRAGRSSAPRCCPYAAARASSPAPALARPGAGRGGAPAHPRRHSRGCCRNVPGSAPAACSIPSSSDRLFTAIRRITPGVARDRVRTPEHARPRSGVMVFVLLSSIAIVLRNRFEAAALAHERRDSSTA